MCSEEDAHPSKRLPASSDSPDGRLPQCTYTEEDVNAAARYIGRKLTAIADKHYESTKPRRRTVYDKGYQDGWDDGIKSLLER